MANKEGESKDEVMNFLKSYAEILKEDVDLSLLLPVGSMVDMPGGGVKIWSMSESEDERYYGKTLAYVCIDERGGPSMPVGPGAMTLARLIVKLLNTYYELKGKDHGKQN